MGELMEEAPMFQNQSAGLMKQTIWKEMGQQLCIVMMSTGHLQLRFILPTAPRAARKLNIDWSLLPKLPLYPAFLGNLPCNVTEDSIKDFFRGLNINAVRLPYEPSNPYRLKGLGYAEFENLDSLLSALSLKEESLGNRRIRVDVADQAQDKNLDECSFD